MRVSNASRAKTRPMPRTTPRRTPIAVLRLVFGASWCAPGASLCDPLGPRRRSCVQSSGSAPCDLCDLGGQLTGRRELPRSCRCAWPLDLVLDLVELLRSESSICLSSDDRFGDLLLVLRWLWSANALRVGVRRALPRRPGCGRPPEGDDPGVRISGHRRRFKSFPGVRSSICGANFRASAAMRCCSPCAACVAAYEQRVLDDDWFCERARDVLGADQILRGRLEARLLLGRDGVGGGGDDENRRDDDPPSSPDDANIVGHGAARAPNIVDHATFLPEKG